MTEDVTVQLDAEILARAREADIDLSKLLTRALRRELPLVSDAERKHAADEWYAENKEEVDSYNEFIAKHGLFSDDLRKF